MSSFGFVSGKFGGLKSESSQNGKTLSSFTVEFHLPGKDGKMIPQLVQIKAFSQRAIEKLTTIPVGARVECQLSIGGRSGNDGRIWNDITLDYDRVMMVAAPKTQAPTRPPAPQKPLPNPIAQDGSVGGVDDDNQIPF